MSGGRPSRRLVAVWALLGILVAVIATIHHGDRAASRQEGEARDERRLLPAPIAEIGAVEILNKGTLYRFERDAAGAWFYHGVHAEAQQQHAHTVDPAAAERIEKALAGFGRARKEREFALNVQADEFGVTRPDIFIMAYLPNSPQPLSRYAVGVVAPDNVSRYVLPVGSTTVVTIPDFQITNLLQLIASFEPGAPAANASR
ncbi:MAG TPA: hypothetical protein VHA15_00160 [Burkholderiales bacterium]|jgi:hypothetical protein|nr:hypothetical protein [Burkholderiales bacterium]